MNDFFGRILNPDNRLADTLLSLSNQPNLARAGLMGLEEIDSRLAAEEQAKKEASTVARNMKLKILEKSLEAFQRPDLTEEQRAKIGNDISTLSGDLGVDPTSLMNIPPVQPEPIKLGGSLVQKGPDGKFSVIAKDESRVQPPPKGVVVPRGGKYVSPDGQLLVDNPAPTSPAASKTLRESPMAIAERELSSLEAELSANPENKDLQERVKRQRAYVSRVASGTSRATEMARTEDLEALKERWLSSGEINDLLPYAVANIRATLPKAQAGKAEQALKAQVMGVNTFRSTAERLNETLMSNPTAATNPAGVSEFINNFAADIAGVSGLMVDVFKGKIDPELGRNPENYSVIRSIAADRREVKQMILDLALAYASASGLGQGRFLSNADVERAINQMGGGSRDWRVIMAGANSVYDSMLAKLASTAKVEAGDLSVNTNDIGSPGTAQTGKDGWQTLPNGVRVRMKRDAQ